MPGTWEFVMSRTPCEEYGHLYKNVWEFSPWPERKLEGIFRVCDDCGHEYEITDEDENL